jgi:DNA invertase Pin-like site-specific DNA recombinase/ribosomal protein L37AE/L43A
MVGIYCRTSKDTNDGASIEQQKKIGIDFCELNEFEYDVYEDEGKSGFKLSDDDDNPFKNRPSFNKMINDIKKGVIDKVWVYEHSRISRNLQNSSLIFTLFDKYNVRVFEKNNELNLKDNTSQFLRQILDAASQYERNLIVDRTTRGFYSAIDKGLRCHAKFYGYKRIGKNEQGYLLWEPIPSEIEKIKFAYKRFLEGATLRQITFDMIDTIGLTDIERKRLATKWGRFLRHFEYTGYNLNMEGLKILHQYDNYEIDSIKILNNEKYYIKCQAYKEVLISVEDWIKCAEKIHINRKAKYDLKTNNKNASKDIGTGIIKCAECGYSYFAYIARYKHKGKTTIYNYYKHHGAFNSNFCKQMPKSIQVETMDEVFKLFYFYFCVVFDNTKDLMKESQRRNKMQQMEIKEAIKTLEKKTTKVENQISKFNIALDETENTEDIKVLAHRITENEEILKTNNEELKRLRAVIEKLNIKFESDELLMTYYDVKEKVNNWFSKLNIEEQRNELIKTIRKCLVYSHYILIEAGAVVFFFDILSGWEFDIGLLDTLNKDENFKEHFIEGKGKMKVRQFKDETILRMDLTKGNRRILVYQYMVEYFKINYDLSEVDYFVSFVRMKGVLDDTPINEKLENKTITTKKPNDKKPLIKK